MDPPGIYPIIVIITSLRWHSSLLTWKRGRVNCFFISAKWDNVSDEINKLNQKMNYKMHSETSLAFLYDHATNHMSKYAF